MTTSSVSEPKLTAAVIGGSIAGLMASLVLHNRKFDVTLYEREKEYSRSIQWTVRQSFINYLFSVDKAMAEHVFKKVSPMTNGFRYLSDKTLKYPDGAYKHRSREHPSRGSGVAPTESCEKSLDVPAVGIIRAKELEECLLEHIRSKTNVTISRPHAPLCERSGEGYVLIENPEKPDEKKPYDLIVVCVGAGRARDNLKFVVEGKSREEFPAKSNPLSRWLTTSLL